MAIYINGKSVHPFIKGKRIATIYRGGKLIYRDYVKVGTTLWNGNTYYTSDTNITLNQPMSKLKTGIVINATNYDNVWWQFTAGADDPNHPTKYDSTPALNMPIHQQIPFKSMANGGTYDLLVGDSYNKFYIRFTKVNDTTIKVGYSPLATSTGHGYGGTTYYDTSAAYPYDGSVDSLIIASITAY